MKISNGKPRELVSTLGMYGNKRKKINLVRFDDNGEYFVPESDLHMFNSTIVNKLLKKGYKVDAKAENKKDEKEVLPVEKKIEEDEKADGNSFICDVCGFEAKTKMGLLAHSRKHKGE